TVLEPSEGQGLGAEQGQGHRPVKKALRCTQCCYQWTRQIDSLPAPCPKCGSGAAMVVEVVRRRLARCNRNLRG
ncbi:MAG: hypothetical protein ABID71_10200, partial [Chloroflexota bacterium]